MPGHPIAPDGPGVGPLEAHALIGRGAVLLDVREDFEWDAGHAPMAQHLPLGQLPGRLDELGPERRLVVVCRSGSRSAQATAFLVANGFDVVNLEGGMQAWAGAGLPVAGPDGTPGTIA